MTEQLHQRRGDLIRREHVGRAVQFDRDAWHPVDDRAALALRNRGRAHLSETPQLDGPIRAHAGKQNADRIAAEQNCS